MSFKITAQTPPFTADHSLVQDVGPPSRLPPYIDDRVEELASTVLPSFFDENTRHLPLPRSRKRRESYIAIAPLRDPDPKRQKTEERVQEITHRVATLKKLTGVIPPIQKKCSPYTFKFINFVSYIPLKMDEPIPSLPEGFPSLPLALKKKIQMIQEMGLYNTSHELTQEVILGLCACAPMSCAELSPHVKRLPNTIFLTYMKPLLASKLVVATEPEVFIDDYKNQKFLTCKAKDGPS